MIERLKYGLGTDFALTLEVPQAIFEETVEETRLGEILERPEQVVKKEAVDGGVRLVFDTHPFQNIDPVNREALRDSYAKQWLYTFVNIKKYSPRELGDPFLDVDMSSGPLQDRSGMGRHGMTAELPWPLKQSEDLVQHMATTAMRSTAVTVGVVGESIIDSVYAVIGSKKGVEFQALDIGCCCLTTDGMIYRPEDDKVILQGHNLYNAQVMMTCLSGLISLARSQDN